MKSGDSVVYLSSPLLYGTGEIVQVLANGRLEVTFDDGAQAFTDSFDPHELELLAVWAKGHDLDVAA